MKYRVNYTWVDNNPKAFFHEGEESSEQIGLNNVKGFIENLKAENNEPNNTEIKTITGIFKISPNGEWIEYTKIKF